MDETDSTITSSATTENGIKREELGDAYVSKR
jgi:hypothetical protein